MKIVWIAIALSSACLGDRDVDSTTSDLNPEVIVADQYVAPTGDDHWTGTSPTFVGGTTGPVKTIGQAQFNLRASTADRTRIVAIAQGRYEDTSLTFTAADSGTQTAPIVYTSYAGIAPVISGGVRVTGWSTSTTGLCAGQSARCYRAALPASTAYFEALYYNGVRRLRPRLGSASSSLGTYDRFASTSVKLDRFHFVPGAPVGSVTGLTVAHPGLLASGAAAPSHDVVVYDFELWDADVQRIASIDVATNTAVMTGSTVSYGSHGYMKDHRYIVENVRSSFHTAGQWFLDRSVAPWALYYLANPGEDATTATIEIPQAAQVLVANNLSWVTFSGLDFVVDNYVIPETGYAATQLQPNVPAMVECRGCQHVMFDGDTFARTTGVGVAILSSSTRPATDDEIASSTIFDTGAHGIRVGDMPRGADTDANVPHAITVHDNAISGVGRVIAGSDLVNFGDVHDCELGHNDGTDSYHGGLELCMPAGDKCQGNSATDSHGAFNNNIHDNNFFAIMQGVTDDGGCYYTMTSLAPGTGTATGNRMTHNSCHDVSDGSASGDPDGYGGNGYYLDNGTGGWAVLRNLGYRCSSTIYDMTYGPWQPGTPNTFIDNISAWSRGSVVGPSRCPQTTDLEQYKFIGNIVLMDRGTLQKGGTAHFYGTTPLAYQAFASNSYCVLSANGCSSPTFVQDLVRCGDDPAQPIGVLADWQKFGEDAHSVVERPDFADPMNGDFSAKATPGTGPTFPDGQPGLVLTTFGRTVPGPLPQVAPTFVTHTYGPADF